MRTHLLLLAVSIVGTAGSQLLAAQSSNKETRSQDCSSLVVYHSYSQALDGGLLNLPVLFGGAPPGVGLVPSAGAGFLTFFPNGRVTGRVTLAIGLVGSSRTSCSTTPANTRFPGIRRRRRPPAPGPCL